MRTKIGLILVMFSFSFCWGRSVMAGDLQKDIERAAQIIRGFNEIPEQAIPAEVLEHCQGLAIMTVAKGGFILSGRGGAGVVIAKTPSGWSAPSAIGTGGAGFGFQIGGQINEFVIVLNTPEAVEAFSQGGNVTLGGGLSVAAGPVGRTAEGAVTPVAAIYTYSKSKGIFAGVSLEGSVIVERKETNEAYYGHPVSAKALLSGEVPVPEGASILTDALNQAGPVSALPPQAVPVEEPQAPQSSGEKSE